MIQKILPNAVLKSRKKKKLQIFQTIKRYDPTAVNSQQLEKADVEQEKRIKKKKENKRKEEISIQRGVDRRKKKILRANYLLGKSQSGKKGRKKGSGKPTVKKIDWGKWKSMTEREGKEETESFTLFGNSG